MERDESRKDGQETGQPSDTEELIGDTQASGRLTDTPRVQPPEGASRSGGERDASGRAVTDADADRAEELGHS